MTDAVTREPIRRVRRVEPVAAWPFTPRTSAEAQAREEELLDLQQYVETVVRESGY